MLRKPLASIVVLVLLMPQAAFGADLSPERWTPAEKALAEQRELKPWPPEAKTIEGKSGLVAGTMSPIAVLAGMEALRQGGTAADAAATVALTQITAALGSYVSYAGILELVYYDAKSGKVSSLNAGWNSYLGETDPKSIPVDDLGALAFGLEPTEGAEGRKTLVPGFMAGIEAMHKRFGKLPFPELFTPAIWYAEHGVAISPTTATFFKSREKYLSRTAEGRAFMNQAGDGLPKAGNQFVQADLAKTLRAVANNGSRYMYTGPWGQHYVEAVQREGGKATMEDMKRYRPFWEEPLSTTFLGHTVYVPGMSSNDGHQLLESLNLAEELKLDQAGPYNKDPKAFQLLTRIVRKAVADNYTAQYMSEHGMKSSRVDSITKAYAKNAASLIAAQKPVPVPAPQPAPPHHSDAVVVIDRWGNVAALVHTIHTLLWGTTGIVVDGIPIADAAGFQQARLTGVKPGGPVPIDMTPVIAMTGNKPSLALASIGESLGPETVRLMVTILANHLDPLVAMAAPPMLMNARPLKEGETFMTVPEAIPEGAYDPAFLQLLQDAGVRVEQKPKQEAYAIKGTAVLATIDAQSGTLQSVETPGIFGFAAAY